MDIVNVNVRITSHIMWVINYKPLKHLHYSDFYPSGYTLGQPSFMVKSL